MILYIEVENGIPKNHPAFQHNLIEAFGEVPLNWEPFERGEKPHHGIYQVIEAQKVVYEKINGVWTDIFLIREMTEEEKLTKQRIVIDAFNSRDQIENWSAWIFDENTCEMKPPIPRPARVEGKTVFWCGAELNWKEAENRPKGNYKFDFSSWEWVDV